MKIETKFDIGDRVWFIYDNHVMTHLIFTITVNFTEKQKGIIKYYFYNVYNENGEKIPFEEVKLFATKEELIKSL